MFDALYDSMDSCRNSRISTSSDSRFGSMRSEATKTSETISFTDFLSSSLENDEVDCEMKRLKLELQKTTDLYSTACKQALTEKQKAWKLHRWRLEEERRLGEVQLAEEAARRAAEQEKAKYITALEHDEAAQRVAEMKSKKRIVSKKKAVQDSDEKDKTPNVAALRYSRYPVEDTEEATEYFSEFQKIGERVYDPVFQCFLDDIPVAVKALRPDAAQGRSQHQQEKTLRTEGHKLQAPKLKLKLPTVRPPPTMASTDGKSSITAQNSSTADSKTRPNRIRDGNFDFVRNNGRNGNVRMVPAGLVIGKSYIGYCKRREDQSGLGEWVTEEENEEEEAHESDIDTGVNSIPYKAICSKEEIEDKLQWSREVERYFIYHMAEEARTGRFKRGKENYDCLFKMRRLLHWKFDVYFTHTRLIQQVERLEQRFKVFMWIISHPGFEYDSETSTITADATMWAFFKQEEPLAYYFELEGETCYEFLYDMFGANHAQISTISNDYKY